MKNRLYILIFCFVVLLIALLHEKGAKVPLPELHLPAEVKHLPYYALRSFSRMLGAYLLALFFSLSYGYLAATNLWAERILIPLLDILQSIPVLGFFPAALYFFATLLPEDLGVEMASVFLIFTAQAWNMAFGVYESILTLPVDSGEVASSYGITGWLRFRKILLPSCIPKLVYNSIISWAGGWYFLIACEIIAVGPINYKIPGLGSFLVQATEEGELGLTFLGLAVLIAIVIVMEAVVWRPLSIWATKFRYELSGSTATPPEPIFFQWWTRAHVMRRVRRALKRISLILSLLVRPLARGVRFLPSLPTVRHGVILPQLKKTLLWLMGGVLMYTAVKAGLAVWRILQRPWPDEVNLIPLALGASSARLMIAYLVSLAWTLPVALWAGEKKRVSQVVVPLAEIGASIPATALFPLIVLLVVHLFGEMNIASILLILTGMQWYLLFNLVGGVNNIPAELKDLSLSLGLPKMAYWRKIALPAIFPSLITGSITAWGGGWNALVISEYFVYKNQTYSVLGIGSLLVESTHKGGQSNMIFLSLTSMVILVTLINRLFWRRLYDFAVVRFRIE